MRAKLRQLRAEVRTISQGRSARDRARIAGMLTHSHIREGRCRQVLGWLPERRDDPREVQLRSGLSLVGRRGDGTVLFEHFGLDVYGVAVPGPVRTIVDLGANVGFATLRLSERYEWARFICVEPSAAAREMLAENVGRNNLDAQIFGLAVVARAGTYGLDAGRHFGGNRVTASSHGEIEGITLGELLDRGGIDVVDLLKVDIEGGELEVFGQAANWAPRVRSIIAELHDGLTQAEVERRLGQHGYQRLPLPDGLGFDDLICLTRDALPAGAAN